MVQKKRQSLSFKTWSISRKSWLLILPLNKNLGRAFELNFYPGGGVDFEETNPQKFKCPEGCLREGGML